MIILGHVNSGKSSLSGQLGLQTGQVDPAVIRQLEADSRNSKLGKHGKHGVSPAAVMDTSPEERDSGNTVTCGGIRIDTGAKIVDIIDAPGHRQYVRDVVKRMPDAEAAVLVVPAPDGDLHASVAGGRIQEHAVLARAAGVKYVIVAINKMDAVDYSQDAYEAARKAVASIMKKIGYVEGATVWFVPVSALAGVNLKDVFAPGVCPWWTGGTLLKAIDDLPAIQRNWAGPLRFRVTDREDQAGTAVGTVVSGTLRRGPVVVMPGRRRADVVKIEVDGVERASSAGEIVSVRLTGVDRIAPGDVVCDAADLCETSDAFYAKVRVYDRVIAAGQAGVAHLGCATVGATVARLLCYVDPKTGKADETRPRPMLLRKGDVAVVEVRLDAPACLARNADCPELGKLVIRDGDETVLTGVVTRTTPQAS